MGKKKEVAIDGVQIHELSRPALIQWILRVEKEIEKEKEKIKNLQKERTRLLQNWIITLKNLNRHLHELRWQENKCEMFEYEKCNEVANKELETKNALYIGSLTKRYLSFQTLQDQTFRKEQLAHMEKQIRQDIKQLKKFYQKRNFQQREFKRNYTIQQVIKRKEEIAPQHVSKYDYLFKRIDNKTVIEQKKLIKERDEELIERSKQKTDIINQLNQKHNNARNEMRAMYEPILTRNTLFINEICKKFNQLRLYDLAISKKLKSTGLKHDQFAKQIKTVENKLLLIRERKFKSRLPSVTEKRNEIKQIYRVNKRKAFYKECEIEIFKEEIRIKKNKFDNLRKSVINNLFLWSLRYQVIGVLYMKSFEKDMSDIYNRFSSAVDIFGEDVWISLEHPQTLKVSCETQTHTELKQKSSKDVFNEIINDWTGKIMLEKNESNVSEILTKNHDNFNNKVELKDLTITEDNQKIDDKTSNEIEMTEYNNSVAFSLTENILFKSKKDDINTKIDLKDKPIDTRIFYSEKLTTNPNPIIIRFIDSAKDYIRCYWGKYYKILVMHEETLTKI